MGSHRSLIPSRGALKSNDVMRVHIHALENAPSRAAGRVGMGVLLEFRVDLVIVEREGSDTFTFDNLLRS